MILITGGAGYIGSHTVLNFITNGMKDIVIFDSLETGHIEIVEELRKYADIKFVKGDLRNLDDIRNVFIMFPIEAVIHFAAFSLVGESVSEPAKYYRNNIFETLNLLDAMVEFGCKNIVFSSTCATYGEPEYTPIDEKHPQKPINPYGMSKLMVERILKDYEEAYGIKSIKLRYFNVAGCDTLARIGEWHEPETHLIPNILKSTFNTGKTFQMFGTDYETKDGTCVRDYIDIEDLVNAHVLALNYLNNGGKTNYFNLGTNEGNTVKEVFSICENVTGQNIAVDVMPRREGDPAVLVADNKKAKNILNWQPKNGLEQSIKNAYAWEKANEKD